MGSNKWVTSRSRSASSEMGEESAMSMIASSTETAMRNDLASVVFDTLFVFQRGKSAGYVALTM